MTRLEDSTNAIFAAQGQMPKLMRAFDWSSTLLGDPQTWPQSLRSALSICLNTRCPICIYWGPEHVLLYNDAWSSILGDKHPWALGRTAREVWPEIWHLIGARFAKVTGEGEAIWSEDELLPMRRRGYTEECYFNFTVSPIRGEGGTVAGIFNAVIETSGRVISERRTRLLRKLAEGTAAARSAHEVCMRAAEILASGAEDVPFCLIYQLGGDEGAPHAQLAAAAGIPADSPARPGSIDLEDQSAAPGAWPLQRVLRTGELEILDGLSAWFGVPLPGGAWPEPARSAAVIPIRSSADVEAFAGVVILGINPRRAFDEDYRSFAELVASSVTNAIARARAYEEEQRRAAERSVIVEFAMNSVREGAFLVDDDSRFLYVNDEACRSLGYSREELLRMRVPDIDPDFPAARWATYLREVTREGSLTFETRHKTKDGRIFPVEINTNYFKYNGIHYSMALVRDITERKNREEKICLLLHEVNHRAKNMLSVVAAIAKKTATTRPGEFLERFSERIQSLAASQDLFIESQWQRVDIEDLARAQLAHLRGLLDSRITLDGLPLHIAAPAAQLIGMALHELAANACMYGALSNSAGQVAIAWRVENDSAGASRFSLSWTENGGPPVVPPFRAGFGSIVLRELPQAQLDAEVQLDFAPTGLRWRLECPAEMLLEDTRGGPS